MTGVIKRIVRERGFGFIRDEKGLEYFFHQSGVTEGSFDQMFDGQPVSFDVVKSPKGPRAENVQTATEG